MKDIILELSFVGYKLKDKTEDKTITEVNKSKAVL